MKIVTTAVSDAKVRRRKIGAPTSRHVRGQAPRNGRGVREAVWCPVSERACSRKTRRAPTDAARRYDTADTVEMAFDVRPLPRRQRPIDVGRQPSRRAPTVVVHHALSITV
jgi:hypothetical protein